MNRKFEILTDALYRSMRFDGDMQEYFDAFMEGRFPLYTETGVKLNPYDYIGKTGRRLIRFSTPDQKKFAESLISVSKRSAPMHSSRHLVDRIARLELELSGLKKELGKGYLLRHKNGCPRQHNRYHATHTPRQDGKVVAHFPVYRIPEEEEGQ